MALNSMGLGFVITARDLASKVFARVGKGLGELESRADTSAFSLEETGEELRRMGTRIAAVGAVGLIGLGIAANAAKDFGRSVAEVASITERAAFPIETIEQIGKDMASTYGGDLNVQVKTLYQAVSSGASTAAEATTLMHESNKLAVGGLSDSFKAVDALTNVLNAYGMRMSEAAAVSDAMFVTTKVGKTTIDELAMTIGRVAPTTQAMGVSMNEMFAAVTAASTKLGNATESVTGFKAALANILQPSKDASDEARRLGIEFDAAALRTKGLDGFLQSIITSGKYNADTLGRLFNSTEAYNFITAIAANNGKSFTDALTAMTNKAGAADSAFRTLADASDFAHRVLMANLQVALVNIGQALLPVVSAVLRFVNSIVSGFNRLPKTLQSAVTWLVAGASAALVVVGGFIALTGAIAALLAAKTALLVALKFVGVAFATTAAVMAPLILLSAGIYAAWTRNIGGLSSMVGGALAKVQLAFDGISQLFSSGRFSGSVLRELNAAGMGGVKDFAITVFLWFNRIKNFLSGIGDGFASTIGPGIDSLVASFGHLVEAFGRIFGAAKDGPDEAMSKFITWGTVGESVGKVLGAAFDLLSYALSAVVDYTSGFLMGLDAVGPVAGILWDAISNLVNAFGDLGAALTGTTGTGAETVSLWQSLGGSIGVVTGAIVGFIGLLVQGVASIVGIVAGVVSSVRALWDGLAHSIADIVQIVSGLLSGDWSSAWQGAKNLVFDATAAMQGAVMALVAAVAGMIDNLGKLFHVDIGAKQFIEDMTKTSIENQRQMFGAQARQEMGAPVSPVAASLPPAAAPAPSQGTAPAVAQAAGAAVQTDALRQLAAAQAKPPPPIALTARHQLVVDGQVLADVVSQHQAQGSARGYAPAPAPT